MSDVEAAAPNQVEAGGTAAGVAPAREPAHVIVFGNEKGGSGKSTAAMHVTVALMRLGYRVGTLDLDMRQWTLTRYLSNRAATVKKEGIGLPMPQHVFLARSDKPVRAEAEAEDKTRIEAVLARIRPGIDFLVIDCPGTDTYIGRVAHSWADKLVTPINDSFVDLDVVAHVDGRTGDILRPSVYAEMVWEERKLRAQRDGGSIDWIVMRNRLSSIDARNKREMQEVVDKLAKRIGFRVAPGFSERVIYRELFLRGLTMLDMFEIGESGATRLSHVAARQEVRGLLNAMQLPNRAPSNAPVPEPG